MLLHVSVGLCVFVVKGGEEKKTFVSSLNLKEHVTSCPRCAGRFEPHRGMDSSTTLCAGLRVQAKDAISFGAIGTPGLLLVPDVAEQSTMTTKQNMLDKCFFVFLMDFSGHFIVENGKGRTTLL